MKNTKKKVTAVLAAAAISLSAVGFTGVSVFAAPKAMPDGTVFDAEKYAALRPDVVAVFGTSEASLYKHYQSSSPAEQAAAQAAGAVIPAGTAQTQTAAAAQTAQAASAAKAQTAFTPVPMKSLANYANFKKRMTNAEFTAAYTNAVQLLANLQTADGQHIYNMSRADQLVGVASLLRAMADNGYVQYSTSLPHYNDPYGYLVTGVASCAGCTRTTGMMLNILGIPYEHVNENQWRHQWCRVPMPDGSHWICDAYGLYVGPEPAPYTHPYFN